MPMRNVRKPGSFFHPLCRRTFCFILAGGRGTRLRDLTRLRAKPATPFGGKYRIIDFSLSNAFNSGFQRIAVLTQYNALELIAHVQRTWSRYTGEHGHWVGVLPADQRGVSEWYKGTADAVYRNLDTMIAADADLLLVLAGDHVYQMDYLPLVEAHVRQQAEITMGCVSVPLQQAGQFGILQTDDEGRVRAFVEKPADASAMVQPDGRLLASMGIYVFSRAALMRLLDRDAVDDDSAHDFGSDVLPIAIESKRVFAYRFDNGDGGYWRDVGTVSAYYQASMDLIAPQPPMDLYNNDWPVWSYQEHLPPAKLARDRDNQPGTVVDSLLSAGCVVQGASIARSVLCNNVRVDGGSVIHDAILLPDVRVGRNCRLSRVIVDEGCRLPDGLVAGENLELDAARFLVADGGITVITREHLAAL